MSDGKVRADWTDRELLVYILSAMEYSNVKPDYTKAPVPVGRNVSGCVQRVGRLKKALKNDMDALKNGMPVSDAKAKGTDTKGKNKRKAADGDGDDEKPKKRGRPKKVVESEVEAEAEVKQEATPETEGSGEEEAI